MRKYKISGMSCAACAQRVENAVLKAEGVRACSVNLLLASMTVEGATDEQIVAAVRAAGYDAAPIDSMAKSTPDEQKAKKETRVMALRLILSVILLLPLTYLAMSHHGLGLPTVSFLSPTAEGIVQAVLALAIIIINFRFFINGARGVISLSPNMDTLVALGSSVAFVYSLYKLIYGIAMGTSGEAIHSLHFEMAAMILTFITVGKMLEGYSKGKTTSAISALMNLTPKYATVIIDGVEKTVDASSIKVNDVFIVRPGESFAVDGVVIDGVSSVDQSSLTGESMPVEKQKDSPVYAATVNNAGHLTCRATGVGEDTAMARVVKTVYEAAASKAPIAKVADRVSAIFVPAILLIAFITTLIWLFACGFDNIGYALERGIAVLVISCPCALGLATPVAITVASGIGATGGILFKNASAIEACGEIKTVALDKTGTLTTGVMSVSAVIPFEVAENELLSLAVALEGKSEHPIARAIMAYTEGMSLDTLAVSDFSALVGCGVVATVDGEISYSGNLKFISEKVALKKEHTELYNSLCVDGKTPIFFTRGDTVLGIIAVADTLREDSRNVLQELSKLGIRTVMLTGDNNAVAEAIGNEIGVSGVYASLMPTDKDKVICELQKDGKVLMVGDGINDSPALTRADVGIAVSKGVDIAIESADVVLMRDGISLALSAIKIGKATLRVIYQNLFWAFIYNLIGIPLAAGAFAFAGITLPPMFGAMAMSLSSFCVVMNALRLKLGHYFDKTKIKQNKETVENKMEITVKVEGMMCPHCEARVKSAVEGVAGVESASASHKDGTVIAKVSDEGVRAQIISAIENAGYKVL